MSRWRCDACQGEYRDPQPDGTSYSHVCPPLVDPDTGELQRRDGHRDETVVPAAELELVGHAGPTVSHRARVQLRAEGAGRTMLPD